MKVLLDTLPLESGHAIRGIGTYTRLLADYLEQQTNITVVRSKTEQASDFEPDIIHFPYFDLFEATLPILKSKPTVVTIHDVIPLKFPEYYPVGIRGRAKFIKQKSALKTVRAVITDSNSSKEDIHHHLGVPLDKIFVVYLAANPTIGPMPEKIVNKIKKKYQLPKNYVLYVGDINYNKNIPQLIKAVRDFPRHLKLVCLGQAFKPQDIPEWQWIETQLALSDVQDRVKFISDLPAGSGEELAAIYTGAVAYVQPSFYEGFGLPVLEAMAAQTPVICANNSSLLEVAGEHAILIEPRAENIARAVNLVADWSKSKRQSVVRAASKWNESFSWEKTAKETSKVYQQVL